MNDADSALGRMVGGGHSRETGVRSRGLAKRSRGNVGDWSRRGAGWRGLPTWPTVASVLTLSRAAGRAGPPAPGGRSRAR